MIDPERPWIHAEPVSKEQMPPTVLERLAALENHITRLDKADAALREMLEERR